MKHFQLQAAVLEDERQLDGSRHLEIVADDAADDGPSEVMLRLVIDRDGALREAELSLQLDGEGTVLTFDGDARLEDAEALSLQLSSPDGEAILDQQDDGVIALKIALADPSQAAP